MEVYVNGQKAEYVGSTLQVPLDKDLTILVKKSGYMPYSRKIRLNRGETSVVIKVPELERARIGLLTTSLNYSAGSRLVYELEGETIEKELPFKEVQFPEGAYEAKIINPVLGTEKKVQFSIEKDTKHFLE
jgi:hypothetical protein